MLRTGESGDRTAAVLLTSVSTMTRPVRHIAMKSGHPADPLKSWTR